MKCYIYVKIATFEQDRLEKFLSLICNIVKWKMLHELWKMLHSYCEKCYTNCEKCYHIYCEKCYILMLHELWKMLPQYRHQCSIVPKCTCVIWIIFSVVSEVEETGLTIENHRPWASNSSTLFSLIEAEKDIDIKVYKLFIYNNNTNHKRDWRKPEYPERTT